MRRICEPRESEEPIIAHTLETNPGSVIYLLCALEQLTYPIPAYLLIHEVGTMTEPTLNVCCDDDI